MTMKNITHRIAMLIALLAVSTLSWAGPNHNHPANYKDQARQQPSSKIIMKRLSKLDLSDSQKSEIEALVVDGIESTKIQRESLKAMIHQMKALRFAESIDETAIKSLSLEIANVKSDLTIARLNKRKQIAVLLTDEQQEKMKKLYENRKYKRGRY